MAVSATKDFWIHPNALTITLNYFDDPQLIQTSMLAGSVILAYNKNYIGYDAAHNYREWKLQAFPTQLNDTCAYYVHAELSRDGDTAMIIYSPVKRDIEGRSFIDGAWDSTTSSASWFIYLGEISASVDADGATVERVWTDGLYTGTLATDQQRLEDAQGDWALMFQLNSATGLIDFLRTVSSATFNALTVAKNFIFGGHTFTSVASTAESGDEKKRNDATLPTTGYVQKEIEALDDHFLIKDGDDPQDVGGDVSFGGNVSVAGEHSVVGSQTIGRNQTIGGSQEVKGLQTLHEGFVTNNFSDVGGQITGAQLTQAGVFSVAGLKAMSFEIFELIYNKIRAVDGKLSLSSTGVIEHCEIVLLGSGLTITPEDFYAEESDYTVDDIDYLWITFKEDDYNKGLLQFTHNDILYGYVNQIGESGQYARGGQSCMYVLSTNEEIADANEEKNGQRKMTIKVKLFADDITDENGNLIYDNQNQVVGNMSPTIGMSLAHRGNINGNYPERMTSFFIDSQSGNIIMLQNVMTPQINKGHYGVIVGKLPTDLYNEIKKYYSYIASYDPVVYARYGIFENILQFDHLGKPIQRENNRGEWVEPVLDEEGNQLNPYKNMPTYYDTVTRRGSLYKCVESDTIDVPGQGDGWLLLVSRGDDGKDGADGMPYVANLLDNTGFEKVDSNGLPQYWENQSGLSTVSLSVVDAESSDIGMNALNITKAGRMSRYRCAAQTVRYLTTGKWYTLSFWLKSNTDGVESQVILSLDNIDSKMYFDGEEVEYYAPTAASSANRPNFSATSEWTFHRATFNPTTTYLTVGFGLYRSSTYSILLSKIKLELASDQANPATAIETPWSPSNKDLAGRGIKFAVVSYCQKETTDISPENFDETDWGDFPADLEDGWWLYSRTITTYSDDSTSKSYSVTQNGQGSYYAGLQEYYAAHDDPDVPPTGYPPEGSYADDIVVTGSWAKERPTLTQAKPYLWNFSQSFDSRGNSYVTKPMCIGNFAKGIVSIVERYAISAYSSPNSEAQYPTDITAWVGEQQDAAPTAEKPYQWNFTETTYNDGSKDEIYHVSAVRGKDGLTTQPNLLRNSNFDLRDDNNKLRHYVVDLGAVVEGGYDSFNSYSTNGYTGSRVLKTEDFTLTKGGTYTLSCVAYNTSTTGYSGTGFVLNGLHDVDSTDGTEVANITILEQINVQSGYPSTKKSMDIYFGVTPEWEVKSITFTYIGEPKAVSISYYCWADKGEIALFKLELSDSRTPFTKHVDDLIGPQGKDGPMMYSAGNWTAGKLYTKDDDSVPFVYYDVDESDDVDGTYYVLKVDSVQSSKSPAEDTDSWRPMQYYEAIYTKFLMANWAKFGGENGGVFYGKWLFSQDGVTSEGEEIHYSEYEGDIFDEDGELGKGFTPNLAIDFKTGAVVMNNLTEMFHHYGQVGYVKMGNYNNIIVQPCSGMYGYETQGFSGPLVILPQQGSKSFQNGSSISIFAEVGNTYMGFAETSDNIPLSGPYAVHSTFALISAENILGTQYADDGYYSGSWIVCHGRRSKYLILAAGDMVRLRMTKSGDIVYWVVENSSDIDTIEGDIYVNKDLHWVEVGDFKSWVDYEGYEGTTDEGYVQIAFENKYAQSYNWNRSGDLGNPYVRMLFASKTFISTNAGVYLGYNNPHIILSTHREGWWDSGSSHYHYRLLDKNKDVNFPLTKEVL